MNLSFAIGLFLCLALCVFGIVYGTTIDFGRLGNFVDIPSVLITIGGTLAAMVASFPFDEFLKMIKHFPIIMGLRKYDPVFYINTMTELSTEARKKGLLSLEDSASKIDDPFLKDSVMLIVDAMEPDKVREQLENEMSNIDTRHQMSWDLYDKGAALAPGFGMIGTLIGLVNMLAEMNFEDEGGAATLAANMAVALITTFYGSFLSNVIFIPLGSQLKIQHGREMLCKEIVVEGVLAIQAGENPRNVNEKLMAYLTRTQRAKIGDFSESAGGES